MRNAAHGWPGRKQPVLILGAIALSVFACDTASKWWALANLDGSDRWFGQWLRLTLFQNHGLGWGLSLGTLTPLGTALATAALVALMLRVCRELAAVDSLAPVMLGLLAGAGMANGLDVFLGPSGVLDFISFPIGQQEAVLNVADVAAAIGIVLCGRTVWVLARAIRAERAKGAGLRAEGLGLRAKGLGLRSEGLGLRSEGVGLRAEGSRVGESTLGSRFDVVREVAVYVEGVGRTNSSSSSSSPSAATVSPLTPPPPSPPQ